MEHRVAEAIDRIVAVLQRRPGVGVHADVPAISRWDGGLSITTAHTNGTRIGTDMPAEFGGKDASVSPGWLMRAALASCAATCIAMAAAQRRVELISLEVRADSRSDARGLFRMTQTNGDPVSAGPYELRLHVRIATSNAAGLELREMVQEALDCSPVAVALRGVTPVELHIEEGVG